MPMTVNSMPLTRIGPPITEGSRPEFPRHKASLKSPRRPGRGWSPRPVHNPRPAWSGTPGSTRKKSWLTNVAEAHVRLSRPCSSVKRDSLVGVGRDAVEAPRPLPDVLVLAV